MLTMNALEQLRTAYNPHTSVTPEQIRQQIGNPSDDEIIMSALDYLHSDNRNARALALRVLAHFETEDAVLGIFGGLGDHKRRVREVAVQSSINFVQHAMIAVRLKSIAFDVQEKRKIRERAFSTLLGIAAPVRSGPLPQTVVRVIEPMIDEHHYRDKILHGLVQIDTCEAVTRLLRKFVADGTPEEVALAQKALGGFRMVNIGHFEEGPQRDAILRECELAHGRVYYWVPRKND